MREPTDSELVHERLGDRFGQALSDYDTLRRVEVLVDEFLPDPLVRGRLTLDVGCGLGHFSRRLVERGAHVTACDIGPALVARTRELARCEAVVADALNLVEQFGPRRFDLVVSSECIEHTPDPARAVRQMARVLKPGGYLSLSTPNRLWWPAVRLATALKLRPFDGHENFSSWGSIARTLAAEGMIVERRQGLHLFPFQFGLHSVSRWCDRHAQFARSLMINLCVLARKRPDLDLVERQEAGSAQL